MKSEAEIFDLLFKNPREFYSMCRLCLSENILDGKSIFSAENSFVLAERVMFYAQIQIKDNDGLPSNMCNECYKKIVMLDQFVNKTQEVDVVLKRVYFNLLDKKESLLNCNKYGESVITESKGSMEEDDLSPPDVSDSYQSYNCNEDSRVKKELNKSTKTESIASAIKQKICKRNRKQMYFESPSKDIKYEILGDTLNETLEKDSDTKQCELFICDLCRKVLKSKKSLENHINNVHNEEKRRRDVGRVSGYGAERRYHCTECDYCSKYKIDLVIHIRRHTGEKPYVCNTCYKSFAQQSTLNNHIKTHSDTMYFTCPHCGKQFKYKYKYEKHKNAHTEHQRYICTICNRALKSTKILQEHMNRHYNIKNFNCETCGSTFVTFSEMSIHSRIHGTEKRFQCHLCEYKTFVKASLEKHVRRHTGERPFVCQVCNWKCYTRGELKVHSRTHTKEKNYSCPVCTASFKTSSALNKHVIRTHGIKYKWSDHKDRRIIK